MEEYMEMLDQIIITLRDGKIETQVVNLHPIAVIAILETAKLNAVKYWQETELPKKS
jgi:hypothetical protein